MKLTGRQVVLLVLSVLLATTLSACGNKNPSYYGAFIRKGGNLIEITSMQVVGVPSPSDLDGIPVTDSRPVIVLWEPDTNLQYLEFYSATSHEELKYTADSKKDGSIDLRPTDSLRPGRYCFIQGNPSAAFLRAWCFEVRLLM
jgi:hypothetical protein